MSDGHVSVGLVIVSHSAQIAEGTVALAQQMAPDVQCLAAGGLDDGSIGTSFDKVSAAVDEHSGDVCILCDLGSAVLTSESVIDFLDEERQDHVKIADAPIVEGAVAAAIAAQSGSDLEAVIAAADHPTGEVSVAAENPRSDLERKVTIVNKVGLHARPVAELSKTAAPFDAEVTIDDVSIANVLQLMGLGLKQGDVAIVRAHGPQAMDALDAVTALIESGFGEA